MVDTTNGAVADFNNSQWSEQYNYSMCPCGTIPAKFSGSMFTNEDRHVIIEVKLRYCSVCDYIDGQLEVLDG